jgi:WD40 repeat protein
MNACAPRNQNECPDRDILVRFSLGDLPPGLLEEVTSHVLFCSRCCAVLDDLQSGSDDGSLLAAIRSSFRQPALPEAEAYGRLAAAAVGFGAEAPTLDPAQAGPDSGEKTFVPRTVGPYLLVGRIGEGGMGAVYRARQLPLNRDVAVKMILSGPYASPQMVARFRTEGQAVARLKHPHVVEIYDFDEHDGQPYFAMELVEGGSLADRLKKGPLPPRQAAELVRAVAEAIESAHEKGVLHRDLKPANVLLTPDGTPKVSDFGLAKMLDAETGLTREGAVMGTAYYMAPEQAAGRADLDRRADVYALGAILYELLTGRPPLKGETLSETLWLVLNQEPASPRKLAAEVDRDLEIICLKCLEKEPDRRFATALELADELERYLNDEPILTRRVGFSERAVKWARRRPAAAAAWLMTLLVVVLGTAGGFAGWQWLQAEAARGQADSARQQAEEARREAEEANAGLEKQKRLADEARGWALKDRLKFEQAVNKAREPVAAAEARLRREFDDSRKRLTRGYYFTQIDLAHRLWRAGQLAQARRVLNACLTGATGWEYGYVDRLCHGATLPLVPEMGEQVQHLGFSRDGSRLAAAENQGVFVWDFPARTNPVRILVRSTWAGFTPDGKSLLVADGNRVKLFDTKTGAAGRELADLGVNHIDRGAVRPDGSHLAVLEPGREDVLVIDLATGKRAFMLPGHRGGALAVAYSPDGKRLATATNDGFRLWDAATGKETAVLAAFVAGHRNPLGFSRDGKRIACIDGGAAGVWDVASGERVLHVEAGQRILRCAGFTAGGELVTGGSDTTVRTWDVPTGRPRRVFRGLPAQAEGLATDPKGRFLVAWDRDGKAAMWDPAVDQEARVVPVQAEATGVAFHPEGKDLAVATRRGLRLLSLDTGKQETVLAGEQSGVAYGGRGRWLIAGGNDGVVVLDRAANREAWKGRDAQAVGVSPAGDLVVVAGKRLTGRDAATGKVRFTCDKYAGQANDVAFSHDGSRFAVADSQGVMVYNASTGKTLGGYPVANHHSLTYSPDAKRLAAALGNTVVIWDAGTGQVTQRLTHVSLVNAVAFSADGRRVATGGWDHAAQVWDAATGQLTLTIPVDNCILLGLAFSPDGRWLAGAGTDGAARLWDAGPQERN